MLQFELRVVLVEAEQRNHIIGLQHLECLDELVPADASLCVLAVPVEVLHELLQVGGLLVFGLVGQKHDLYFFGDLAKPLLYAC